MQVPWGLSNSCFSVEELRQRLQNDGEKGRGGAGEAAGRRLQSFTAKENRDWKKLYKVGLGKSVSCEDQKKNGRQPQAGLHTKAGRCTHVCKHTCTLPPQNECACVSFVPGAKPAPEIWAELDS